MPRHGLPAISDEAAPSASTRAPQPRAAPRRLGSLDMMRGIVMASIIGLDGMAWALADMAKGSDSGAARLAQAIGRQFSHVGWEGLRYYDLILPGFIFLAGVSVPFSLGRHRENGSFARPIRRIVQRTLILFALGLIYYGGASVPLEEIRWVGVLQRIAICYLAAALLFLFTGMRGTWVSLMTLLVGYWAVLTFVPVPDLGVPTYEPDINLPAWVDLHFMPGKLWYRSWDPEGLLSTLPAIATCLIGVVAGDVLTRRQDGGQQTSFLIGSAGGIALLLGYVWSLQFPIIKSIWTSSFVLASAGYLLLILGVLHYVVDVRGYRAWGTMFTWIGANAILLYMVHRLVGFELIARRLVGGDIALLLDRTFAPGAGRLLTNMAGLALAVLLARYLYQRRIFLRA